MTKLNSTSLAWNDDMTTSKETAKKIMENKSKNSSNPAKFIMNQISKRMIETSQTFASFSRGDIADMMDMLETYPPSVDILCDETAKLGNYEFRIECITVGPRRFPDCSWVEERYIFSIPEEVLDEVDF